MAKENSAPDEAISVVMSLETQVGFLRKEVVGQNLIIASLVTAMAQERETRRAQQEILLKILEAVTRESDGRIADAIERAAADIAVLVADVREVRKAVVPARIDVCDEPGCGAPATWRYAEGGGWRQACSKHAAAAEGTAHVDESAVRGG